MANTNRMDVFAILRFMAEQVSCRQRQDGDRIKKALPLLRNTILNGEILLFFFCTVA
jgi:hypothetical protein